MYKVSNNVYCIQIALESALLQITSNIFFLIIMAITHNNSVPIPTRKLDKLNCKIMKMCSQPEQKEQSLEV